MSVEGGEHPKLGPGRQLATAFAWAPMALARMSARSWVWFGLYFGLAAALLFGLAGLAASNEQTLERALLAFLFPAEWHGLVDFLMAFVFKAQAQQVVVNVVLFVTLNIVSLAFFWAKEGLSQSFERDRAARRGEPDPRGQWREYPIRFQAL